MQNDYLSQVFANLLEDFLTPFDKAKLNAYLFSQNIDYAASIKALVDSFDAASGEEALLLELAYIDFIKENTDQSSFH